MAAFTVSNPEDGVCPICLEPWESQGAHQICCLPCGHLYGTSCIKTWIQEQSAKYCPMCHSECQLNDVIKLHAPPVVVLDKSLEKKIESLQDENTSLKTVTADLKELREKTLKESRDIKEFRKKILEESRNLKEKYSGYEERNFANLEKIKSLESDNIKLKNSENLQNDLTKSLETKRDDLQKRTKSLEDCIVSLKTERDDLKKRLDSIESNKLVVGTTSSATSSRKISRPSPKWDDTVNYEEISRPSPMKNIDENAIVSLKTKRDNHLVIYMVRCLLACACVALFLWLYMTGRRG